MGDPIHSGASPEDAEVLCIVLHGRGQTQADMMEMIVSRLDLPGTRFALPKSDGPGWYEARAIDPLTQLTRDQMASGLRQIADLIAAEMAAAPGRPLLLCGFSQGACMAVELLMAQAVPVAAACLFTGCRVGDAGSDLALRALPSLPVYASCGDNDPWIPAPAHHVMLGHLTRAGARIRTDMLPGRPHEIADAEIAVLSGMLSALGAGQPIWGGAR